MEHLDTKPILELIREEAKKNADRFLADAKGRAMTILEQSQQDIAQLREDTIKQAEADADILADRLQRLSVLEDRKHLLTARRKVMDQAFSQALSQLHNLPQEELAQQVLLMVLDNAQGSETLLPGNINAGYFAADFVSKANQGLEDKGKPGQLRLGETQVPDVCGVVLQGEHTQVHCTFESLLLGKREQLEGQVAQILFPHQGQ